MENARKPGDFARGLPGCLLIFAAVTAAVSLIRNFDLPMASVIVPALWGAAALLPGWGGQFPPPVLGVTRSHLAKGLRFFLISSAVVFPLYGLLFYLSVRLGFPAPPNPVPPGVTILHWTIYNFAIVAFTEELFFRGYLQGRLEEYAEGTFSGKGVILWFPVLGSALLFALAHAAADLDPARMSVFFPGLLFGWLRARTGAVLAPILSHGSANALYMLLIRWVLRH